MRPADGARVVIRGRQSGQILPWAVAALAAAALLAILVAKQARLRYESIRMQTAVDVTAMATGTAYARGLNVAAASNQVLLAAAVTDAALKLLGAGVFQKAVGRTAAVLGMKGATSLTGAVTRVQDLWAGTWASGAKPGGASPRPAGFAPLMMEATAFKVGRSNSLAVVPLWNGRRGPAAVVPDLNLRRATAADVARLFRGGAGKDPERRYSYRREDTGELIEVPEQEVERIRYRDAQGNAVERPRIKGREGNLAGKFLHVEKVATKALKILDFPLPLVERERTHLVVIVGRPLGGERTMAGRPVLAQAEVGGGEVFCATFGDPSFEVRLVEVPAALAEDAEVLRLLASPDVLLDWVKRSAMTMLADFTLTGLRERVAAGVPRPGAM